MLETQAMGLNRFLLLHAKDTEPYLSLEPFSLKQKHLKALKPGIWIDLGKSPPALQIRQQGRKVADLHCNEAQCIITKLTRDEEEEFLEYGRVSIEGRIALIPPETLKEGSTLKIPPFATKQIILFIQDQAWALARLIQSEQGDYALEIKEQING